MHVAVALGTLTRSKVGDLVGVDKQEFFLLPISEQSPVGEDVAGGVKTRSRRWMSVCRSHPPMRGTSTDPNVGRQEVSQSTFSHTSWHRVQC